MFLGFFSPFYAFLSMSFSVFIIVSDITRALLRLERTMNAFVVSLEGGREREREGGRER